MTIEIIKLFLTVISLLFTGTQIYFVASNIKSNMKWNAQNAAFNYCSGYSDLLDKIDESIKLELNLITINELNQSSVFYANLFDINTPSGIKNRSEIDKLLQYYEKLSVGILCDYFDEEVVRRVMNRTFTITYKNLRPYILLRRGETQSNICTHFERVGESWINTPLNYPRRDTPLIRKERKALKNDP